MEDVCINVTWTTKTTLCEAFAMLRADLRRFGPMRLLLRCKYVVWNDLDCLAVRTYGAAELRALERQAEIRDARRRDALQCHRAVSCVVCRVCIVCRVSRVCCVG